MNNRPVSGNYHKWTRQPVVYLPVTLSGTLIGYLWAAKTGNAAGFERRLDADGGDLTHLFTWERRLSEAAAQGLPPIAAVQRWIGAPESPEAGGIAAGTELVEAADQETMWNELNPDGPPLGPGPLVQDGLLPDSTPVDRAQGWGPLVSASPPPTYATVTSAAVRFLPVVKNGSVLGYLWASVTGDAADYLPRSAAGDAGKLAAGLWRMRLGDAHTAGLSATDAIRHCRTYQEDSFAGMVDRRAELRTSPNLASLAELDPR
ncbi:hypothetical protein [Nocardia arthritidis]|uniref:Uncharacterized protein n=1 Tax=Nocardia arthritidis TaxID=228602 RepID=A0A6G9Y773_9NOCA|nr:hypothetical protein [Nocardia arthritidis]QIS08960.1 hypothetical protein F5544_05240 [Nocardia arthritidis]